MSKTKARLLVADDTPLVLKLVAEFLTLEGYDVVSCGSLKQAIHVLAEQSFDLVILDGFDGVGWTFADHLRKQGTKVLMLSSYDPPPGFNSLIKCVRKGTRPDYLRDCIKEELGISQLQ